jgi:hypothetical protein
MIVHELFAGPDGSSHWRDVPVAVEERVFAPPAKEIEISEATPAERMLFLRLRSGWDEPVHPTPVRQRLICLSGCIRVTASDGTFRDIGPGAVWDMLDDHGQGHHTKVTSAEDFTCVIVQMPPPSEGA